MGQKKSEIKRKNHVRRCSLLRESRRPDDANEFRAHETRERKTGESVEKPNRREDPHRDHGAGCSLHRLPGSVPRGAKRRRASRRRRTVVGRRRLGRDFVLLFVLVGARRVGTIGLVREREKRNKVRNHSKSTQNTSEREKKECVCIDKTRENEREREGEERERFDVLRRRVASPRAFEEAFSRRR